MGSNINTDAGSFLQEEAEQTLSCLRIIEQMLSRLCNENMPLFMIEARFDKNGFG